MSETDLPAAAPASPTGLTRAVGALVVILASVLTLWPGLQAPRDAMAETELLREDRVVDGSVGWSEAWNRRAGPLADRPLGRVWVACEGLFARGDLRVHRGIGIGLHTLLALLVLVVVTQLGQRGATPILAGALVAVAPPLVEAALWLPSRPALVASVLGVLGCSVGLAARRDVRLAAAEGGQPSSMLPVLAAAIALLSCALSPVGVPFAVALLVVCLAREGAGQPQPGSGVLIGAGALAAVAGIGLQFLEGVAGDAGLGWWVWHYEQLLVLARFETLIAVTPPSVGFGGWPLGEGPFNYLRGILAAGGLLALAVVAGLRQRRLLVSLGAVLGLTVFFAVQRSVVESLAGWPQVASSDVLPAVVLAALLAALALRGRPGAVLLSVAVCVFGFVSFQRATSMQEPIARLDAIVEGTGDVLSQVRLARERAALGQVEQAIAGLEDKRFFKDLHGDTELELARLLVRLGSQQQLAGRPEGADTVARAVGHAREASGANEPPPIEALLVLAEAYLRSDPKELRKALATLTDVQRLLPEGDPRELELLLLLAEVREEFAQIDEAKDAYERAIRRDPWSFQANLQAGNFLSRQADLRDELGDPAAAAAMRQRAISHLRIARQSPELEEGSQLARLLTIQLSGNLGKAGYAEAARQLLEQGLARWPDDPNLLFNHGLTLLGSPATVKEGEEQMSRAQLIARVAGRAEAAYFKAVLVDHLVRRGNSQIKAGETEDAHRLAELATETDDRFFAAWILLGDTNTAKGRFEDAIAAYDRAIELEAGNFAARVKRAHAFRQRGVVQMVRMSRLEVAARKEPQHWQEARKQFLEAQAQAIADFELFLELLPDDDKAEETRGSLASVRANTFPEVPPDEEERELAPEVESILKRQIERARREWEKGKLAFDGGDWQAAREHFERALSYQRSEPAFHYWRGRTLVMIEGEERGAIASFDRALRQSDLSENPEYVDAFLFLGEVHARLRRRADTGAEEEHHENEARRNLEIFLRLSDESDLRRDRAQGILLDLEDR